MYRIIGMVAIMFLLVACGGGGTTLQGYVEAEYTWIASTVGGKLMALLVQRGNTIKQGQLLVLLEQEPEYSSFREAYYQTLQAEYNLTNLQKGERVTVLQAKHAQLQQAQADFDFAKLTYQRSMALYQKNVIQKQALDQDKAAYASAQARVDQLTADLATAHLGAREDVVKAAREQLLGARAVFAKARWQLRQKQLQSPLRGEVIDTYYREGEQIAPYQPIVSLLAPENKRILFFLPEKLLGKVTIGQTINVQCDGCVKQLLAKIEYIADVAEYTPPVIYSNESKEKLVYRVKASIAPEVATVLHPGQPITVIIR